MGIACVNYEATFLLLLLISASESERVIFHGSCCLHLFVRVPFLDYLDNEVKIASDISIVVSSFEIKDNENNDGNFIWKVFDSVLNSLNEKAVNEISEFENLIKIKLNRFYDLERFETVNFDVILEAYGGIVEGFVSPLLSVVDGPIVEIISRIVNYIGQWIYLMDACDDYHKDISADNYSPLLYINNP